MNNKKKKPTVLTPDKGKPTHVKVGYRDIDIEWIAADFKTDELTDAFGQYKAREGVIQMQKSLCGQEESNTLLHEVMHACVYGAGLNQAEGPLKEDNAEELVVNQISNYLMGVFRDNPWFLDYIKKNMNENNS
ncbi:MAG: hypothetical protein O3C19_07615 [Bacteroidetes bacterium]|jgi:hypothetical protein|nr:hypothetical protein [Bacteroidota bacterium]